MTARARDPKPRDPHPERPDTVLGRVRYCMDLMSSGRWVRGETAVEIAEDWEQPQTTIECYSAEASRHLTLLGDRDFWMARIQSEADRRLGSCDDGHFPGIARIAADTVGGFAQKHEVEIRPRFTPDEMTEGAVDWLREHAPERVLQLAEEIRRADRIGATGMPLLSQGTERHDEK